MSLRIERSQSRSRHTYWRQAAHVSYNGERLQADRLMDLLMRKPETPIGVEDPYNKHRLLGGFVINRETWVVAHTSNSDRIAGLNIGALSIIGPHVRISPTAQIGERVELQSRMTVGPGVKIGQRSTVLKRAIIEADVELGSAVFVGQEVFLGEGTKVGIGSVISKNAYMARRQAAVEYPNPSGDGTIMQSGGIVELGMQAHVHRGARIASPTFVADSTEIGQHARIHRAIIGNNVHIGHYAVIGEGTLIGDDAIVGDMNHIEPSAWLPAGSYIPGRDDYARFTAYRRQAD